MTRLERFIKNVDNVNLKYNGTIILIDNREYIQFKEKVEWKCIKHDCIFKASFHLLLNESVTCGCPECRKEKLIESSIKGVNKRKELRGK